MVSYVMFAKHHDNFHLCRLVICNICDLSRFVKMAPYINMYERRVLQVSCMDFGAIMSVSGQSGGIRSQSYLKHRVLLSN